MTTFSRGPGIGNPLKNVGFKIKLIYNQEKSSCFRGQFDIPPSSTQIGLIVADGLFRSSMERSVGSLWNVQLKPYRMFQRSHITSFIAPHCDTPYKICKQIKSLQSIDTNSYYYCQAKQCGVVLWFTNITSPYG